MDVAPQNPGLRTQVPLRGTYGVHRQQTHGAMLRLLTPLTTLTTPQDPGIPETENARNESDLVFATDNVYLKDEHVDASPPYFTRAVLATPRARIGPRSPTYDPNDPFAALQRNSVPFPTMRRRYIPPVPFRQWPDKSDASDSSTESDQQRQ